MAQLVEQRIRNAQAVGSSPTSSSRKKHFFGSAFFNKIRLRRVVRRGRRILRIIIILCVFRRATVGDGLPVPHNAEPFFIFPERRGRRSLRKTNCIIWFIFENKLSNPQALCASSFAKGAYAVSHGFADSLFLRLNFRHGLLRKGAARRAED